jgi:hypothetical protein
VVFTSALSRISIDLFKLEINMNYLIFFGVLLCSFAVNAAGSLDKAPLDTNQEEDLFNFVIGSKSSVVARTRSFKSGINSEGELIVADKSSPLDMAFDSDENQIKIDDSCENDSDDCNSINLDSVVGKKNKWKSVSKRKGKQLGNPALSLENDSDDCNSTFNECYFDLNDKDHAYLAANGAGAHASPVPLPCAAWLFGSAMLGLLRKKRKSPA